MTSWILYVLLVGAALGGLYYYTTTINVSNMSLTVPATSSTGHVEFGDSKSMKHMVFPSPDTNPSGFSESNSGEKTK